MCNDTSVSVDLCDASFCQYSLEGVKLNSQAQFKGWQTAGDASVANPSILNTTLNLTVANLNSHYSGVVNLSLTIVVPGVYVTLECPGGEIRLSGSLDCQNQVTRLRLCSSTTCQYSIAGVNSNPLGTSFNGWVASGDANVSNPTQLNTTLTLTMPNPTAQYSGVVNLTFKAIQVPVTIHTFVTYALGSEYANVTICTSASSCPYRNLPNGATAYLDLNTTDEFIANLVSGNYKVMQWDSNVGAESTTFGNPTQIDIASAGTVSLILSASNQFWAGYANSPTSSTGSVSAVSATFKVPLINVETYDGSGVWVGIGGIGAPLWQAGIAWKNGVIRAFWEATPTSTGPKVVYDMSMSITAEDIISVNLTTRNGVSYATIDDKTTGAVWSVGYKFTPNTQSAEWILEPKYTTNATNFQLGQNVTFTDLMVNSLSPTLEGCFYAMSYPVPGNQKIWPGLLSASSGGSLMFTIY